MSEYIVKCPICRKQYKMTPKDPSTLAQKTFSCPNCHYTTPFTSLIKGLAAPQSQTQSEGPIVSFLGCLGALSIQEVSHLLEVLLSVHGTAAVAALGYAYYVTLNACLLHLVIEILAYA